MLRPWVQSLVPPEWVKSNLKPGMVVGAFVISAFREAEPRESSIQALGMVLHVCNFSAGEAEAGLAQVQG